MTATTTATDPRLAGLFRRFAAGFYDGLLLLALAMIAGLLVFVGAGGLSRPLGTLQAPSLLERLANLLLVFTFVTLYFSYGWRKAGQRCTLVQVDFVGASGLHDFASAVEEQRSDFGEAQAAYPALNPRQAQAT